MTNERILYMNIQTISKEKKEVMIELTADEFRNYLQCFVCSIRREKT